MIHNLNERQALWMLLLLKIIFETEKSIFDKINADTCGTLLDNVSIKGTGIQSKYPVLYDLRIHTSQILLQEPKFYPHFHTIWSTLNRCVFFKQNHIQN